MGVSVENRKYTSRIDHLRQTGARVKFLSLEPLLGPLTNLDLAGIDWVIVGGESGPGARPMAPSWVKDIRDQCVEAGVPFFFKQWGGTRKKRTGRTLDGRTWDEYPLIKLAVGLESEKQRPRSGILVTPTARAKSKCALLPWTSGLVRTPPTSRRLARRRGRARRGPQHSHRLPGARRAPARRRLAARRAHRDPAASAKASASSRCSPRRSPGSRARISGSRSSHRPICPTHPRWRRRASTSRGW